LFAKVDFDCGESQKCNFDFWFNKIVKWDEEKAVEESHLKKK